MSVFGEASVNFGLIAGSIALIETSIEIYSAVQDKDGLETKLRKVADKLPQLEEILKIAEDRYHAGPSEEWTTVQAREARETLQNCRDNCQAIHDIFANIFPQADASSTKRLWNGTLTHFGGKGEKVENLFTDMYEQLKILVQNHILVNTGLLEVIQATVDELVETANAGFSHTGPVIMNNNVQHGSGKMYPANSFASGRPDVSAMPTLELPAPPPTNQQMRSHTSAYTSQLAQPVPMTLTNVGSLLTPPLSKSTEHSNDASARSPPITSFYCAPQPLSAAQQSRFPYSTRPSPVPQSPGSAGDHVARASPANGQGPLSSLHSKAPVYPQRHRSSSIHPPIEPVLPDVGDPKGQVALVNGVSPNMLMHYNSRHAAMQQIYGHHMPGQNSQTDCSFRCDQCPQSFNRNHDLKRHKRIHLAVKPFPCGHCDKSFSRKDALKVCSA